MEVVMRHIISSGMMYVIITLSVASCVSTDIIAPDISEKSVKHSIPLMIEYKNLPGEESIAMLTPNGKKSGVTNDPGRLDKVMIPAIEKIVKNKGYSIADDSGKARAVLTIDFNQFGIYWTAGPSSGSGSLKADVNHYIQSKGSGAKAWNWNYKNEKKYGKLPGNCISGIAGCTIIGIIPLMIYINSQGGSEGSQMTKEGNALLADYFTKLDAALPNAGNVVK